MADNTCKKRHGKKDPLIAARTTAKHRARRIAADAAHKARCAATAARRRLLRCKGALARIDRRILAASESARARLTEIRGKVAVAIAKAQAAA